jgi:AcrR family transcriptional regulator
VTEIVVSKAIRNLPRIGVREPIVAGAARLFRERGFADTSMQDIATAVGLSRPALYHHFENKHQILAALVEEVTLHSARETQRIAASAAGDPRQALKDVVRAHALAILNRPELFAVLLREERNLPAHIRDLQRTGKRDLLDRVAGILSSGVDAGCFRAIDPAFTALCIFGMCNWTIEWFRPDGRVSEEQAADRIAELCLAMVERPARDTGDPQAWLALLRDDLAHLEQAMAASPASATARSGKA